MAEQFRSITETRKELPSLSQTVESGGDRYVITNQGKPQAVLLGYSEYKGLLAAAELMNRPTELARLEEGLAQTERISFADLKENLRTRMAARGEAKAAPIADEQMAAASPGAIAKKLDEIRRSLEKLFEQSGKWEPAFVLAEESLRSLKDSKQGVARVRHGSKSGEPVEIVVKHVSNSTRKREGSGSL
jgi:prevent-host-death family protein